MGPSDTVLDAGARYLRADLQVHTPLDPGWPGAAPRDPDERRRAAHDYLDAARLRGIELVGITEHNDVSWIDELRHAAVGLGMHLLPGFEVESKEGIHVLCLFDPSTPTVDLEDLLAQLGLSHERRRSEKRLELQTDFNFPDLIARVQGGRCPGVCIAAHMTSSKGLLTLGGGARAEYWKTPQLLAGQLPMAPGDIAKEGLRRIVDNEDPVYRRDRQLAYVLTSDSRGPDEIGTQSIWIKMHEIGVSGLRQAFLDPGSRIAYADPGVGRNAARILEVSWAGGFLDGAAVALNHELNCLIGGKGTGKSTVIESIRFAFGLEPRTGEVATSVMALRAGALPSGSKVSVLVETAAPKPTKFRVERTAPHAPVVRDELGQVLADRRPQHLLLPRIYGQKEVFGVAQSAQARLELIDAFASEDLRELLEAERALVRRLELGAQTALTMARELDDIDAKLAELPSLQDWRRRFREAGFEDRLRERRQLDQEERLLVAADGALLARLRLLPRITEEAPALPDLSPDAASGLPNADLLSRAAEVLAGAETAREELMESIRHGLETARVVLAEIQEAWAARRAGRQASFDEALRDLQQRMPDVDPERYLDVERRIEQLVPLESTREQLVERIAIARQERDTFLADLVDARAAKHRARDAAAKRLTQATVGSVRVEVFYQGHREDVLDFLTKLRTGARSDALRRLVDHPDFSPSAFARVVRESDLSGRFGLPDGQAAVLQRALSDDTLLALEALELSDAVTIALDVGPRGERDYRPLDRLSPGQKSTAILLLTMQESLDPLLIDQPEDDLDNRFIYDDVVQRLRAAKRRRQIVVATHNANIPVLGDAEQILIMDAEATPAARGYLANTGSIDDAAVRHAAERILEGGEEAFARRREKYGW